MSPEMVKLDSALCNPLAMNRALAAYALLQRLHKSSHEGVRRREQ